MPKRRQQYRRPPRPIPSRRYDDGEQEIVELAAVRLAANQSVEELRLLVRKTQDIRDVADQNAMNDPGPEALTRFREARLRFAEAERALNLAESGAQARSG